MAAALLAGCAKFPSGPGARRVTRLIFTLTVSSEINPNFVYIVALRPSTEDNPTTTGPIPVIAPPWGNGFVAGNCTHFVRWDVAQSPDYLLYSFLDPDLLQYVAIGVPVNFEDVLPGGKVLHFDLDLDQIVPKADLDTFRSLQVNFLTMDHVPQGGTGDKVWDALGDSRLPSGINQFVTIPLRSSGLYDNARFQDLEPSGDTTEPSLDIVNWSVEVRAQ